jgi:hypothetical protein
MEEAESAEILYLDSDDDCYHKEEKFSIVATK